MLIPDLFEKDIHLRNKVPDAVRAASGRAHPPNAVRAQDIPK